MSFVSVFGPLLQDSAPTSIGIFFELVKQFDFYSDGLSLSYVELVLVGMHMSSQKLISQYQ